MKKFLNCVLKIVFSRTLIVIVMVDLQLLVLVLGFTWLGTNMHFLWECMSILGAFLVIYIINKDEPTEFKLTWIMTICLFPVLGALLYLFVVSDIGGIGLKLRLRKCVEESKGLLQTSDQTLKSIAKCPAHFKGFAHYMQETAGFSIYSNAQATYYPLGEDKFRDLICELKKAEKYIFLEYFIIGRGEMWDTVLEILKEKVASGVEVRVMYDGMCSILLLPYAYPKELQHYGIRAKMFAPIVPFLSTTQNNRDHRKIAVIDGRVAFTGGINLADEYINKTVRYGHWKDVAVKVTGEAVIGFTAMFLQMWNVSEKEPENYSRYLNPQADSMVQKEERKEELETSGFTIPYGDTPTRNAEVAKTVYESMITGAASYVHIMTPYFIVDREFLDSMRYAARRGVKVVMILPSIPDKKIVYYIARTYYPQLLKAGIQVYEYLPGFIHAKVFTSDDKAAVVGTVNLDYRSFYHHFECGVYFYGNPVIADIEQDFADTLTKCRRVTMDYYRKIPTYQKAVGRITKLMAPLL